METVRRFTGMNREMEYCRKKRGTSSVRCKRRMLNKSSSEWYYGLSLRIVVERNNQIKQLKINN